MTYDELMSMAEAGRFPPLCLLSGSERLLMERAIGALKAVVTAEGIPGFNDELFQGSSSLTGRAIVQAARTLPMMAKSRFVLVRNVDALPVDECDALIEYAKKPCPETCLVLVSEKLDGRHKLVKHAKDERYLVDCQPPRPGEIPAFAEREARARGHELSRAGAAALADAVGTDLSALNDALERLSLYVGEGKPIEGADVEACVAHLRTDSIWALVDAVSERDTKAALTAAASLLGDREPPLRILSLVARQLRIVAKMRDALASGLRPQDAAVAAGAPPFKANELMRSAKRFDDALLRHAFRVVADADLALKGSKAAGPRVLEGALLALCTKP